MEKRPKGTMAERIWPLEEKWPNQKVTNCPEGTKHSPAAEGSLSQEAAKYSNYLSWAGKFVITEKNITY